MKIATTKELLLKAVTTASKAVPAKASLPIYEHLLFEGVLGKLRITATDGDIVIASWCDAEAEGSACINAKTILELARVLPDGEVAIEADEKTAKVSWDAGHAEIPVADVKDFPDVAPAEGETAQVDAEALRTAIAHTLPHVATDILRPQLTGVHFNPMGDRTDLVGTDSHTICVYPVDMKVSRPFTVSAKSAGIVKDAVDAEKVSILINDGRISFDCGSAVISAREIVGKFPNYNNVIPSGYSNTLTADIKTFAQTVRRVAIFSNKASGQIKLELSPFGSTVYAQDLGFAVAGQEVLDVAYEGERLDIGFKHDYLLKSVGVFDGEKATIQFGDARKAALVTCDGDPARCVVMPIAIQ